MIDLEINGSRQLIDPPSTEELRELLKRSLGPGHLIQTLVVNGRAIDEEQLETFEVGTVRSVTVGSATPQTIARESLGEASDWITRIGGVLESVSEDFRVGKDQNGRARLTDVIEALQVLVSLLQGLRRFLELEPDRKTEFESRWLAAETALLEGVKGLFEELQSDDPVRLADLTGYTVPRALGQFQELMRWAVE
jgi:hypothetical protein